MVYIVIPLAVGMLFVLGGFLCLVVVIPWSLQRDKVARTEFLAGKAAYSAIITGVGLVFLANLALLIRFLWRR